MKTSEIFQACIPLISSGQEKYICNALTCIWHQEGLNFIDLYYLKTDVIYKALNHQPTVGCFISEMKGEYPTPSEVKSFRLMWLDSLVKEYQAKGD